MSIGLDDIVIGRRIGVRLSGGGASLDADAATLIAAMTTAPDSTRQGHINTLITGLKADGVWAELDELWVTAAHAEQAALLGWKRYKDLTAVNAPTFEMDRGFTGNGSTSYLNTNFVPSTDGVQYTLNDASLGVYSRTDSTPAGTLVDMGVVDASDRWAQVGMRSSSGTAGARVNHNTTGVLAVAAANSIGLGVSRRTAADAQQIYRNGVGIATNATASVALPNLAVYIGALGGATPFFLSTRQYAAAFVGAAMSEAQQLALYTRTQMYLSAIGANVGTAIFPEYSGYVGPYDSIPSLSAVYGMRRMLSSYRGALIRLRRASDNAERDFGYDEAGDLDTAAVNAWLTATTGYVVTWYDQSGNANNATQATAASQPLYVASGQNGKPVARWDGTDDSLATASAVISGAAARSFIVAASSAAATRTLVDFSSTNVARQAFTLTNEIAVRCVTVTWISTTALSAFGLISGTFGGNPLHTGLEVWLNGNSVTRTGGTNGDVNSTGVLNIGYSLNTGTYLQGDATEIVVANAAWSTAQRQAAETAANAYWSIY